MNQQLISRRSRSRLARPAPAAARALCSVGLTLAALAVAALAPAAASATITPSLTLNESAGTAAGSTTNLGISLALAPTANDTIKDLTFELPPGLLANAATDGGACLTSATPTSACQVGSGTVTASLNGAPKLALPLKTTYDLVAPPSPSDIAGLQLMLLGQPLGSPAAITLRGTTDPDGVGLDIVFTDLPDTYTLLGVTAKIEVHSLTSTFDGLRFPDSCPATPATVGVIADSYTNATPVSTSAPLTITGCSSLPFAPTVSVQATQDAGDSNVQISTDVTESASEATSRSLTLTFPPSVLGPDLASVVNGGIVCASVSSGTCKPVGSVSATSPLYPHTLTGTAYFTEAAGSEGIALVIPPPFGLTLSGTYDIATNATTFAGIPDFPLTALDVTLYGGADGLFDSVCSPSSGTITASLVSQNGDHTAAPSAPFTIAGCHAAPTPVTPGVTTPTAGPPTLSSVAIGGLSTGKPTMRFTLTAGKHAAKLSSFTVKAPSGLSFVTHVVKHHATVTGVAVSGGTVKSLTLSHGQLVVTLKSAAAGVTVKIGLALTESASLKSKVKSHKIKTLKLTVVARDSSRHSTTLAHTVKV